MSGLRSGGGAARDQQGGHGRRKKPSEDGSTSTGSGVNLADIQYCARRGHSLDRRSLRLGAAIHFSVCDAIESDFIESAALKSMQNTLKNKSLGTFSVSSTEQQHHL